MLCEVTGESIKRLELLIGEPIELTGQRALREAQAGGRSCQCSRKWVTYNRSWSAQALRPHIKFTYIIPIDLFRYPQVGNQLTLRGTYVTRLHQC